MLVGPVILPEERVRLLLQKTAGSGSRECLLRKNGPYYHERRNMASCNRDCRGDGLQGRGWPERKWNPGNIPDTKQVQRCRGAGGAGVHRLNSNNSKKEMAVRHGPLMPEISLSNLMGAGT